MRDGCAFCNYEGPSPILARSAGFGDVFIIEPIDPVAPGHVLVIPEVHVPDFSADGKVSVAVLATAIKWIHDRGIESYNIITSKGADATQSVFHLHVHIVPRSPGDGLQLPWTDQEF